MTHVMTWINPGEWTALSNGNVWALAHTAPDQGRDLEVWKAASAPGVTAHQILAIMLSAGLDSMPPFALAQADDARVRLIVRHPAVVRLEVGDDVEEITAEPGTTWIDVTRPCPERLFLTTGTAPSDAIELPLALGAGAADLVTVDFTAEPPENPADATAFMSVEDILADDEIAPPAADAAPTGTTVLAVRCDHGHLNSPAHEVCRICATPIPVQQPFETVPPPLGCIVVPSGERVPVDDGIIIGRAPAAVDGQKAITIAFSGEISRQHAEISVDGWNVYVRDLQTTNGTTLTQPGQPEISLRPGENYGMQLGAELDLAGAVTLRFEANEGQ